MRVEVENVTTSETGLVHFSGGSIAGCPRVQAGVRLNVEFKPGDMLAYTGKPLQLRADHDGKTVQWPKSFID